MDQNIIQFPKFWDSIEKSLVINPKDIETIKEILTILQYTSIESIMKFTKKSEIQVIEIEFSNRKTELVAKYPHLKDFAFHSGFYTNLNIIASKVKKSYIHENNIDSDQIVDKVLEDAKEVNQLIFKAIVE